LIGSDDTRRVRCPYCREWIDLFVDPDTIGEYIEDCEVCCRPWQVRVCRDEEGRLEVSLARAQ
jgi:hypothetical protein